MAEVKGPVAANAAAPVKSGNSFLLNLVAVLVSLALAIALYIGVLGSKGNFSDPDKKVPKNLMGTMYHGGFLVPVLIACFFVLIVFTIERIITVLKSTGNINGGVFVKQIKSLLDRKDINGALSLCDRQGGSVGNVMKAGLVKYGAMANASNLTQEQKLATIQKEIEEATSLELPMLEKNLVFISTIATIATLLGLLGTVSGMISAFSAMGQAGAPDANKLATGISEALINTALGIGTSFFAIIIYNLFTTIIDKVTYSIDESGFSLAQSFKSNYPA